MSTRTEKSEHRKKKKRFQKKRKLRQKEEEDDEEDEEEGSFPAWKTTAVIVVIVACFAVLYPKMFHPMLMFVLGLNKKDSTEPDQKFPHPNLRGSGPTPGRSSFSPDPHIHAGGPHPGMRMPPQMGNQQTGKTGGKGMWHWMLPFYTVGVIVFLLYTLSKILWKSPKKRKNKCGMKYKTRNDRLFDGEDSFTDDSADSGGEEHEQGKLSIYYSPSKGNTELRGLQKRLNQTETAMQRILEQLETISGSVDQATAESVKKMTVDTLNNLSRAEARVENSSRSLGSGSQKDRRKDEDGDVGGGEYLQDLEKALTDFKKFTDSYVQQHAAEAAAARRNQEPEVEQMEGDQELEDVEQAASDSEEEEEEGEQESEEETDECSEDEGEGAAEPEDAHGGGEDESLKNRGFDPMVGEDPNDLSVPVGVGEIIPIDESGVVKTEKIGVRKRPRKT